MCDPVPYQHMGQGEKQQTVLVVEDEPLIRMAAIATFEDAGFHVLSAKDSAQALGILASHSEINILVTDVCMPGIVDGLGLVALVRRDHPTIQSIVVSGNTTLAEARQAGAAGFVSKPYLAHAMVQAIRDIATPDLLSFA